MAMARRTRQVFCDPAITTKDDTNNRVRQVAAFLERTQLRGVQLIEPIRHHSYRNNGGGRHV